MPGNRQSIRESERFLVLGESGGSNGRSLVYGAAFLFRPKECEGGLTSPYEEANFCSLEHILGLDGEEQEKES
jgi:hypothetical protein